MKSLRFKSLTIPVFSLLISTADLAAVGTTRLTPIPAAEDSRNASSVDSKSTGNDVLPSATLTFSDDLDLVTTNIFTGGISFNNVFSDGKKVGVNAFLSSSLPASKPESGDSNRYNDAQLMLPDGGVINFTFSPFTTSNVERYAKLNASRTGGLKYGRLELSDRRYFKAKGSETDIATALEDHSAALYSVQGLGPKIINRDSNANASEDADGYGLAFHAYAGIGFDGSFVKPGPGETIEAAGNYRVETYLTGVLTDKTTMRSLYSSTDAKTTSYAWAGNASIAISGRFQANVRWAFPLGSSRKDMGKIVLVGLSVTR